MTEPTYNLTKFGERLAVEKKHPRLAGKIRRAKDLASMHTDLTIALESLDALKDLTVARQANNFSIRAVELALLSHAILLYARATKTSSKIRSSFDIQSKLTSAEKVVHKELVDLRDMAIAHFGTGGAYNGLWHAEAVILQFANGVGRVGVITRQLTYNEKLIERTRGQIKKAHELVRKESEQKISEVTTELNELTPDTFEKEIRQHSEDLDAFLSSAEAAEIARTSANAGGYTRGIVRHKE